MKPSAVTATGPPPLPPSFQFARSPAQRLAYLISCAIPPLSPFFLFHTPKIYPQLDLPRTIISTRQRQIEPRPSCTAKSRLNKELHALRSRRFLYAITIRTACSLSGDDAAKVTCHPILTCSLRPAPAPKRRCRAPRRMAASLAAATAQPLILVDTCA